MAFYTWTPSMSVGIDALDSDHKALTALINRLHEDLKAGRAAPLEPVLDRLLAYVEFHFAREEKVMEACGFPGLDFHREEHEAFAQQVDEARQRLAREGAAAVTADLLEFLKIWLNAHILIQDKAYQSHAEGNPAAQAAADALGPGLADKPLDGR